MFQLASFNKHVSDVNSHFARFKESALDPLLNILKNINVHASSLQKSQIQNAVFSIPADKQKKYKAALDYLANACGVKICGCPVDPTMELESFRIAEFLYHAINSSGASVLNTAVPGHQVTKSLHHVFDFKFKSSTGDLSSLRDVGTREHVKFRTKPGLPPFSDALSDTPSEFTHGESTSGGQTGYGRDDYMTKPPALICLRPLAAGVLVAEQWYQFTVDGGMTWNNIPGAAYLIEKGIRMSGDQWVFYFAKKNWDIHNRKHYHFEAEFALATPAPALDFSKKLGRCGQAEVTDIRAYASKIISLK